MRSKWSIFLQDWVQGFALYLVLALGGYLIGDTFLGFFDIKHVAFLIFMGAFAMAGSAYIKMRQLTAKPKAPGGQMPPEHPAERRTHGPFSE